MDSTLSSTFEVDVYNHIDFPVHRKPQVRFSFGEKRGQIFTSDVVTNNVKAYIRKRLQSTLYVVTVYARMNPMPRVHRRESASLSIFISTLYEQNTTP